MAKDKKEMIEVAGVEYDPKLFGTLTKDGGEIPDPRPMEVPMSAKIPEPLEVKMARMIKNELSQAAHNNGFETLEESLDFEVGDDYDPKTPYEDAADTAAMMEEGITPNAQEITKEDPP